MSFWRPSLSARNCAVKVRPAPHPILAALRSEARRGGRKLPRVGNPQRLFFAPFEPFLVDDAPERRHPGRIARVCLDPIWNWICRDLMPKEAKTYGDQVSLLLAANEKNGAEQVARAFQDLVEQRVRECLAAIKKDEKANQRVAGQIGIPRAIEMLREFAAILRVRDALGVIGSRLPPTISNLAEAQLANVTALLDSPIGRHRDVFLYALLVVMSRLGSPWQLIRLAIRAAASDAAARIAETPFAVAVDVVLTDLDRMIANLRESLKAGRSGEVATLLKDIHDAARALHTEIDLSIDSPWGRQLAASRAEVAELLEGEIDNLPGQVRRLLRPRVPRETGAVVDEGDVAEIEAKLVLAATCRNYASELAISEVSGRVHSDLQNYFDSGTQVSARPAADFAARRADIPPVAGRCGDQVLRDPVRRRVREPARESRRSRRQGRAEGRKQPKFSGFSDFDLPHCGLPGAVM